MKLNYQEYYWGFFPETDRVINLALGRVLLEQFQCSFPWQSASTYFSVFKVGFDFAFLFFNCLRDGNFA